MKFVLLNFYWLGSKIDEYLYLIWVDTCSNNVTYPMHCYAAPYNSDQLAVIVSHCHGQWYC